MANKRRVVEKYQRHGKSGTKLNDIWRMMKYRCTNPHHAEFKHYGGRGITVCEEWLQYKNFEKWALSKGYEDGLTIERLNNDGIYCPENCLWIPKNQINRNKSNTIWVNVKMPLKEACRYFQLNYSTARIQVKKGKAFNKILEDWRIKNGR